MKNILVLLLLLCSVNMFAQDVIVKKDGSTIVCRVIELNDSEIIYKKWADLNGSNYVMEKSLASAVNYENGKKVSVSEMNNIYMPNNQNTGIQQYNDKALLALNADFQNYPKKAKTWRNVGLIGGGILAVAGGVVMLTAPNGAGYEDQMIIGGVVIGCGVVGGTVCLLKSQSYKRQLNRLQISSFYQQNVNFENGSLLSTSIDMINDRLTKERALGIGLSYNF